MVMYLNRTDTKNEYLMMQACHEFEIFSEGCLLVIISESFVWDFNVKSEVGIAWDSYCATGSWPPGKNPNQWITQSVTFILLN